MVGYPETMRHEVINASVDRFEKCAERKMKGPGQSGRRRRGGGRREKELKKQAWSGVRPPNIGPHSQGDVKRDEIV